MNPVSFGLSLALFTNSLSHTPPPSHLEVQDLAQKASHFILHPVDADQLEKLTQDIRSFTLKNTPTDPKYFTIFKSPENIQNPDGICRYTISINTGTDINLWDVFTQNQYNYWLAPLDDASKLRKLYQQDPQAGIAAAKKCTYSASEIIQQQPEKYSILLKYLKIKGLDLTLLLYSIGQQETGAIDANGQIVRGLGATKDRGNGAGPFQIISVFQIIDANTYDPHKYVPQNSFVWDSVTHNIMSNAQHAATVLNTKIIEQIGENPSQEALMNLPLSRVLELYNAGKDPRGYAKNVIYYYTLFYPYFFDETGYAYSPETFSIPIPPSSVTTSSIPPRS